MRKPKRGTCEIQATGQASRKERQRSAWAEVKEIPNVIHAQASKEPVSMWQHQGTWESVQRDEVSRISDVLEYIHKDLGCGGKFGSDLIINTTETKQMKE